MPRPRSVSTTVRALFSSMPPGYVAEGCISGSVTRMSEEQNVWAPGEPPTGPPQFPGGPPAPGRGPLGKVRGTGACMGLTIITLGIYTLYWFYKVHDEMKQHSGRGLGGGIALLIDIVFGLAMPYLTSN